MRSSKMAQKAASLECQHRQYKVFFLIGLLIIGAQIYLTYELLMIPVSGTESAEERNLNKRLYDQIVKRTASVANYSVDHQEDHEKKVVMTNVTKVQVAKTCECKKEAPQRIYLNLTELEFVPPCDDYNVQTISAVQRAKSQACKKQILDIACEIQKGTFYPRELPSSCPRGDHVTGRELGCFQDDRKVRILRGYSRNLGTKNTPERCVQLCLQSGFLYAGVEYSSECFCGDTRPEASAKLPDLNCHKKCSGDPKRICGGDLTINVYETGIEKFSSKTVQTTPKAGAKPVRIAFLLMLNGRAVRQVLRMLKRLYSPQHYYFIHVDARREHLYRELLKLEHAFPNIRLSRDRWPTIWGGASLVQMTVGVIQNLLTQKSNWQWDFVLNLSESVFPLKPVDKLVQFLTANRGMNFLARDGRDALAFIQAQGVDQSFVECDQHMWKIGERTLPAGIQIDGGSDWICLSRDFAKYVAEGVVGDPMVEGLFKTYKQTVIASESFFHTVLRNSMFCNTSLSHNLHQVNWKRKQGCKCQYTHIVDWCGCSPMDLKPDDWTQLEGSKTQQAFFARKFESIINQAVMLQLEEWVFGKFPANYPNLHSYWQNFYHHEDRKTSSDEELLVVAQSILRISNRIKSSQFQEPFRIREMNHFMERDQYRGFLISYETKLNGRPVMLETHVQPLNSTKIFPSTHLSRRLTHLEVSTDFDLKEQLSRNFQRVIGSRSPELILNFRLAGIPENKSTSPYALLIHWINPRGELANTTQLTIEDNPAGPPEDLVHFSRMITIKSPLETGIWTARLEHRKILLGVTHFLVSGAGNLKEQERLDSLVQQFYEIKETCRVRAESKQVVSDGEEQGLEECSSTSWSSYAPDPKSDILSAVEAVENELFAVSL